MTSLPTPFNVEVPRELSSYVGAPQTSTLKGERREIISCISWDHRVPTYYDHDCRLTDERFHIPTPFPYQGRIGDTERACHIFVYVRMEKKNVQRMH